MSARYRTGTNHLFSHNLGLVGSLLDRLGARGRDTVRICPPSIPTHYQSYYTAQNHFAHRNRSLCFTVSQKAHEKKSFTWGRFVLKTIAAHIFVRKLSLPIISPIDSVRLFKFISLKFSLNFSFLEQTSLIIKVCIFSMCIYSLLFSAKIDII